MAIFNIDSSGEEVKAIQTQLEGAGFSPGAIDGIYGPKTASAVNAFQTAAGITADSVFGPETAGALSTYQPQTFNPNAEQLGITTPTTTPTTQTFNPNAEQLGITSPTTPVSSVQLQPVTSTVTPTSTTTSGARQPSQYVGKNLIGPNGGIIQVTESVTDADVDLMLKQGFTIEGTEAPVVPTEQIVSPVGKGTVVTEQTKLDDDKLRVDADFRTSEIARANQVIKDRLAAGLDITAQQNYIDKINGYAEAAVGVLDNKVDEKQVVETETDVTDFGFDNQYKQKIDDLLSQIEQRLQPGAFQFDPQNDAGLQNAQENVARSVREQMNRRGILNSTITQDVVAEQFGNLTAQYEQIARGEFNSQTDRLMAFSGFISDLDTKQFNQALDLWQADVQERKFAYQQETDRLDRERQTTNDEFDRQRIQISDAWDRVEELGYVDNKSSSTLGIPVGTLSGRAREQIQDQLFAIESNRQAYNDSINKMTYATQLAVEEENRRYAREIDLLNEKDAQVNGSPEQISAYNRYLTQYTTGEYGNNPDKALSDIAKTPSVRTDIGNQDLYDDLIDRLTNISKLSPDARNTLEDFARIIERQFTREADFNEFGPVEGGIDVEAVQEYLVSISIKDDKERTIIVDALAERFDIPDIDADVIDTSQSIRGVTSPPPETR